jgi:hypothetical protein
MGVWVCPEDRAWVGLGAEELLREDRRTAEVRAKLEAQRRMLGEAQKILNSA